ncbi:MAG: hypothetical protein LC769_05280, partial [Chloroflexi bacterium]|nr:hypothetical protein [Chloroflexota bacterium]
HTLLCRGSGLPVFFRLAPANRHDAPFAKPLLAAGKRQEWEQQRVMLTKARVSFSFMYIR